MSTFAGAVEALLLMATEPMPSADLAEAVGAPVVEVEECLAELAAFYDETGRGFELRRVDHSVSVRLRSENLERMRQRVRALRSLFAADAIELDDVTARLHAWLAHARHGHTQRLIERELARWTFARSPHPPATCAPGSASRGGSV